MDPRWPQVELHREDRLILEFDAGDRAVIEVFVGDLDIRYPGDGIAAHDEAMVLRSDFAFAALQILDGVVHPAVALEHLLGLQTLAQGDQLVSQADAENGLAQCDDVADEGNGIGHGRRIAGAV